jgi:antimicrobial peptide system SdpB family protein
MHPFRRFAEAYASKKEGVIGVAFLRTALAGIMFAYYVWHLSIAELLVGPDGQLDYHAYIASNVDPPWGLYAFSASMQFIAVLYCLSLTVALAYALGFCPRITCWLFAATTYSAQQRASLSTDAGLSLIVLLSFLLCFADSSQYFTVSRNRAVTRWRALATLDTLAHNSARFLMRWQVCMVYLWSTFYKISTPEWRAGTAMYYILRLEHYAWMPALSQMLSSNSLTVSALTYGTIAVQSVFPVLIWNERAKPFALALALMLHGGIIVIMGLISFSMTMICADLSLLSDRQFLQGLSWFQRLSRRRLDLNSASLVFKETS